MSENQNFDVEPPEDESIHVDIEADGNEIDIEVVDDTPPEDRGRKPLEKDPDVSDDELQQYSKGVQERIKELRHGYHDERRAKESAEREREQAVQMAQQILEENKRLKGTLKQGEAAYLEAAKQKASIEYEVAKRKLLEAKSNGDIEGEVEAQEEFLSAQLTKQKLDAYENNSLQTQEYDLNTQQEVNRPKQVDARAEAWHRANPWFWKDRVMTGAALGLHEDLVSSGYDPRSDDYYRELDSRLRDLFPSRLKAEAPEKPEKKRPPTVVASANRSNPSKKVTLSASEVALAKRLNIPVEVYAKQKLELEKRNG
jgi:hypothetical protein